MSNAKNAALTDPAPKPENSFRDVISLLAIVVTLTIGLLAYIQREPSFTFKVEVGFLLLVSGPLSGLWWVASQFFTGRNCCQAKKPSPQWRLRQLADPAEIQWPLFLQGKSR